VIAVVEKHAARVDPVELEQPNVDWRKGGRPGWHQEAQPLAKPVLVYSRNGKTRKPARPRGQRAAAAASSSRPR
jgi:hypothetical protein